MERRNQLLVQRGCDFSVSKRPCRVLRRHGSSQSLQALEENCRMYCSCSEERWVDTNFTASCLQDIGKQEKILSCGDYLTMIAMSLIKSSLRDKKFEEYRK